MKSSSSSSMFGIYCCVCQLYAMAFGLQRSILFGIHTSNMDFFLFRFISSIYSRSCLLFGGSYVEQKCLHPLTDYTVLFNTLISLHIDWSYKCVTDTHRHGWFHQTHISRMYSLNMRHYQILHPRRRHNSMTGICGQTHTHTQQWLYFCVKVVVPLTRIMILQNEKRMISNMW